CQVSIPAEVSTGNNRLRPSPLGSANTHSVQILARSVPLRRGQAPRRDLRTLLSNDGTMDSARWSHLLAFLKVNPFPTIVYTALPWQAAHLAQCLSARGDRDELCLEYHEEMSLDERQDSHDTFAAGMVDYVSASPLSPVHVPPMPNQSPKPGLRHRHKRL